MNQRATKWLIMATILITAAAVAALSRAEGPDLTVSETWIRPTLGAGRTTAAYVTITNQGQSADRLIAASVPNAAAVELHTAGLEDGVMRMRRVAAIDVPAGETVHLAPGGLHIMVMGLSDPIAAGDEIPVTLTFETAGDIQTIAPVSMTPPSNETQSEDAPDAMQNMGDEMGSHAHH